LGELHPECSRRGYGPAPNVLPVCAMYESDWVQKILKYSIYLSRMSSLLSKIFCSLSGSDNINFFAEMTQDGLPEHFVGFAGQSDEFYTLLCAMGQLKLWALAEGGPHSEKS